MCPLEIPFYYIWKTEWLVFCKFSSPMFMESVVKNLSFAEVIKEHNRFQIFKLILTKKLYGRDWSVKRKCF